MLSAKNNKLITECGPETPGGDLFRRYWQPVALRSELTGNGACRRVRLLGEDLVLFRDDQGKPGLVGLYCPHRCADLSYGRVEDGGIRCIYHGWLFDRHGNCIETPSEPDDSTFYRKIKHTAYPCHEVGDVILAYMGPGDPPPVPNYAFLHAPKEYRFSHKFFHACNYLQANEGNLDPAHTSFLHANTIRPGTYERIPGTDSVVDDLFQAQRNPELSFEETHYGIRIYSRRKLPNGQVYLRVTNFLMPNLAAIAGFEGRQGKGGYTASWHVPIDDVSHYRYDFTFQEKAPVDAAFYEEAISRECEGFEFVRKEENRYLQDREEMNGKTFSGLGTFFPVQDGLVVQSQGPIQDRTKERLGTSDVVIIAARKQILKAIQDVADGGTPRNAPMDEDENDYSDLVVLSEAIDASRDPADHVRRRIEEKRKAQGHEAAMRHGATGGDALAR
jgi:phthalate 4,5-dioxygenase oxygenase subunit